MVALLWITLSFVHTICRLASWRSAQLVLPSVLLLAGSVQHRFQIGEFVGSRYVMQQNIFKRAAINYPYSDDICRARNAPLFQNPIYSASPLVIGLYLPSPPAITATAVLSVPSYIELSKIVHPPALCGTIGSIAVYDVFACPIAICDASYCPIAICDLSSDAVRMPELTRPTYVSSVECRYPTYFPGMYDLAATIATSISVGTEVHVWTYPLIAEHALLMRNTSSSRDIERLPQSIERLINPSIIGVMLFWRAVKGNEARVAMLKIYRCLVTRATFLSELFKLLKCRNLTGRLYLPLRVLSCMLLPTSSTPVPVLVYDRAGTAHYDCSEIQGLLPQIGGGQAYTFCEDEFIEYMVDDYANRLDADEDCVYTFHSHVSTVSAGQLCEAHDNLIPILMPLDKLVYKLTVGQLLSAVRLHGIIFNKQKIHLDAMRQALRGHVCNGCADLVSLIKPGRRTTVREKYSTTPPKSVVPKPRTRKRTGKTSNRRILGRKKKDSKQWKDGKVANSAEQCKFPPAPHKDDARAEIISNFCSAQAAEEFEEVGCAVCAQLVKKTDTQNLRKSLVDASLLHGAPGSTRKERFKASQPIEELTGPIMAVGCDNICDACYEFLGKDRLPINALANGLWIGEVPDALKGLTYAERVLIARARHNKCVVKVQSGMWKMHANAITFSNPILSVYNTLPPTIAEVDEVLAFIYIGHVQPEEEDLKKTPMIVRRSRVARALEWLKLNNEYYADLNISYTNLAEYPENGCPFVYDFHKKTDVRDVDALAVNDNGEDEGTAEGQCSFVVHGLVESDLMRNSGKTWTELKAAAVQHLAEGGHVMAVGHENEPLWTYQNPSLYPQLFPWLFPYGKGGLDQPQHKGIIANAVRKKWMLLYHDKRFQEDSFFPLIALNQEQIKQSGKGGRVVANKKDFADISDRLLGLDLGVLEEMIKKMTDGERINAPSEAETQCFRVMRDLDLVGQHVQGSFTNKRFMRNEIWSLIEYLGAPSWFITFAPSDEKSPICLYFAGTNEKFSPDILTKDARRRLIAQNPVAGAKFFDFIVKSFITHVLGVGQQKPGLYGKTAAYYGTVEQQGRLTLHLHLLLWIKGALTPQEIRNNMMDPNGAFQTEMVRYLEAAHQGEFSGGSVDEVRMKVAAAEAKPGYSDPTLTLATPPPPACTKVNCEGCDKCTKLGEWRRGFEDVTDDLLLKSNMHKCEPRRCYDKGGSVCKSRFPREVVPETMVDEDSGALKMKKGEARMNTFTRSLTYMLRCNTDVTSLLSGTALKAVVAYVTEYVTKCGLKTYHIFDAVKNTIEKNGELIGGDIKRQEKAKMLMTKIVNSLTSQSEIGAPLASLYLLENPDHYTSHEFRPWYWKNYVRRAMQCFVPEGGATDVLPGSAEEKVTVKKMNDHYVGVSYVDDYQFRPLKWENMSLYSWVRLSEKQEMSKLEKVLLVDTNSDDDADSAEEDNFVGGEREHPHDSEATLVDDIGDVDMEDVSILRFLKGHPQRKTHWMKVLKDDGSMVPNFIGGHLPRCDQGDREYYCATMLTFFKPWRTGFDLKSATDSWDDAFHRHELSEEAREKMKFFNVKYECLDARDDFHALRKSMEGEMPRGPWFTELSRVDGSEVIDDDGMPDADLNEFIHKFGRETAKGEAHRSWVNNTLTDMKRILLTSGWLDACPDGPVEAGENFAFRPTAWHPPSHWHAAVQAKKQEVLAERLQGMNKTGADRKQHGPAITVQNSEPNDGAHVQIVDKEWLDQHFKSSDPEVDRMIKSIEDDADLNAEQIRAFRIIANHASEHSNERLQMYLGGMGGTGKSRVIKALIDFFCARGEKHRFLVLAPTGSAAALLSGSTYHSVMGLYDGKDDRGETLKERLKVRATLEGVEYIFLDEVSMLSGRDMYRISAAASSALGRSEEAFGGLNMIFAGDFAQLPPVGGQPLFAGKMKGGKVTYRDQQEAIGRALWQQTTTVVMLRKNMRQQAQGSDDQSLRTALENMRYKACTDDDITYLRSRIAGRGPARPKIASKRFRNVSVITGLNLHKDQINMYGCTRFARETNEELHTFYSRDMFRSDTSDTTRKDVRRQKKNLTDSSRSSNDIPLERQEEIWQLPPSCTNHIPGRLDLCVGMPVMLRYNDATECCITKGAEANVAYWHSSVGPHGLPILDTVFVKLKDPATDVHIEGLPINIVPLTRRVDNVTVKLMNGEEISIARHQVPLVLNFAMTDYNSQGRTRVNNVVDLQNCRTHNAYYTALSRSASSDGTVIVQGFQSSKIQGGTTGFIRQEFRELELLDEITRLKYERRLPYGVHGHLRNTLLHKYRQSKGDSYVPANAHPAIVWSNGDPLKLRTDEVLSWRILDPPPMKGANKKERKEQKKEPVGNFVPALGTTSVVTPAQLKRKAEEMEGIQADNIEGNKRKKRKTAATNSITGGSPQGMDWDAVDWSCCYDSLFTVLYNIWASNPRQWTTTFRRWNPTLKELSTQFRKYTSGEIDLNIARDRVRLMLNAIDPGAFPYGQTGGDMTQLSYLIATAREEMQQRNRFCVSCGLESSRESVATYLINCARPNRIRQDTTTAWYDHDRLHDHDNECECGHMLTEERVFKEPLSLLIFAWNEPDMEIEQWISVPGPSGRSRKLFLRGIIYIANYHFTARVFDVDGNCWFHDGAASGAACIPEGNLANLDQELVNRNSILAVYGKK